MACKLGRYAERSQSDSVFLHTLLVTLDIAADQVDVLPAQWGQVGQLPHFWHQTQRAARLAGTDRMVSRTAKCRRREWCDDSN